MATREKVGSRLRIAAGASFQVPLVEDALAVLAGAQGSGQGLHQNTLLEQPHTRP